MIITPGVTIESGDAVSRQTLYNLWANGTLGAIDRADLHPQALVADIYVSTEPSFTVPPGKPWWDQKEQLLKIYFDEIDGTGVSLYLSIGPDRIDDAFLASEPIPRGAVVSVDTAQTAARWVRRALYNDKVYLAVNNSQDTVASGTWFSGTTYGFCQAMWKSYMTTESAETLYVPAPGAPTANKLRSPAPLYVDRFLPGAIIAYDDGESGAFLDLPQPRMHIGGVVWHIEGATTNDSANMYFPTILFVGSRASTGWEKYWDKQSEPWS